MRIDVNIKTAVPKGPPFLNIYADEVLRVGSNGSNSVFPDRHFSF